MTSARILTTFYATMMLLLLGAQEARAKGSHVVTEGESLWKISRDYGCDVDRLKEANGLGGGLIKVGQKLDIPCGSEVAGTTRVAVASEVASESPNQGETDLLRYKVAAGDTIGAIATRYRTTIADIQGRNGIAGHIIYPGQTLDVAPGSRGSGEEARLRILHGQSIGSPNSGRLRSPARLVPDTAYFVRRPERAFGANHTVYHLRRAALAVRKRFPAIHRLAVGDLSARGGGKITMHASHQSGRDADLGFYFKARPSGYPQEFVVGTESNLHFEATWELITQLARTAEQRGGVERMFLNYATQRLLYKMAVKRGVSKKVLAKIFQYPSGIGSSTGLIRHEPGHDEHLHVRFKCPHDDPACR